MGFIFWILFGALIGWIAGKVSKHGRNMSTIQSIIVGIVGSAVGGFIGEMFGFNGVTGFNLGSILWAVVGAIVVLWVVNKFSKR